MSLLLTSLALLCWPDPRITSRLRIMAVQQPGKRLRLPRPNAATIIAAATVTGWLVAGLGGAAAAALLATTVRHQLRAREASRQSLLTTDGIAEALRAMVAALRTGAHPATAAESAAEDAPPDTAATMRAIAAAARLDGDMTTVLDSTRTTALGRLAQAWQLAQRHGLPLADVLDAVRRDLEHRARFTRQVEARMAGPRASALALTVLPAFGIALGTLMGANPLAVLTGTGLGQLLLLTGVILLCTGVTWSNRITTRAVLP